MSDNINNEEQLEENLVDYLEDNQENSVGAVYDEDGQLVKTSWEIEEEQREKKREQQRLEKQREQETIEAAKREARMRRRREREEENRRYREQQKQLAYFKRLPKYIRDMPVTPKGTPFELPKKRWFSKQDDEALIEAEKQRRKAERERRQHSIEVFQSIRTPFPKENDIPAVITVLSQKIGTGGTVITRLLSAALSENRGIESRPVVSIDLGADNRTTSLAARHNRQSDINVSMIDLVRNIKKNPSAQIPASEYTIVGVMSGEFILSNSSPVQLRIAHPTAQETGAILANMRGLYSLIIADCDASTEQDPAKYRVLEDSEAIVLALPATITLQEAADEVEDVKETNGTSPIFACVVQKTQDEELSDDVLEYLKDNTQGGFLLGFDPYLESRTRGDIKWEKVNGSVRRTIRELTGRCITHIRENREKWVS